MKVTATNVAVGAMLLMSIVVSCSYASPMFGQGNMMKRRFPGASDMSYVEYRRIADANRRGQTIVPGIVTRTVDEPSEENDNWMYRNSVGLSVRRTPAVNSPLYHPQQESDEDKYMYRYPTSFNPRDSFAQMNFPPTYGSTRYGGGSGYGGRGGHQRRRASYYN